MASPAAIKRNGIHYTPPDLADFLAHRAAVHVQATGTIRVLDPACGDGELLFAAQRALLQLFPTANISLEGYDLDSEAIAAVHERSCRLGVPVEAVQADFLTRAPLLPREAFDLIITNPPYVRTQQLGASIAQELSAKFDLRGRIDITHAFVKIAPHLLADQGILALLCSNRFLTTAAGQNVRQVLTNYLSPLELFDLGDTRFFRAAVLPAIVIASKSTPTEYKGCSFVTAYESSDSAEPSTESLLDALTTGHDSLVLHQGRTIQVESGSLIAATDTREPWRMQHPKTDEWLNQVEKATFCRFGDAGRIRVGIKTTADSVFISDDWDHMDVVPEQELLLPLITHEEVEPWRINSHCQRRVLYPYDLTSMRRKPLDLESYPRTQEYLTSHEVALRGRKYVLDAGRKWYEIWVPQNPALWSSPKIVFPDISVDARFALDESGAVVNGDCYWISLADVEDRRVFATMLAVANSSFGLRYYDAVCGNRLYSGRRRWMTQYVAKLPLPNPATPESANLVEASMRLIHGDADAPTLVELDELVDRAFSVVSPKTEQAALF